MASSANTTDVSVAQKDPTAPSTPWLLVFDLDGTLIDSSRDLCNAVNAALSHVGRAALPSSTITAFVGDGAAMLVQRALNASLAPPPEEVENVEPFDGVFEFFLNFYAEHKLDHTRTYAGVLPTLQAIRLRHPELLMAVLTNKPVNPSREICAALGLSTFFFANYGGNSFPTKKPAPEGLTTIVEEARRLRRASGVLEESLNASGVVMIGDSDADVLTAKRCGTRSLGCRYGLAPEALMQSKPDVIVDSPEQWIEALAL